ncbi:MAG: RidA family protein, partial [Dehalococcoidia bacterium]
INVEDIYSYKDNLKISHAVKSGNTIYISGQVAVDPQGNLVGKGDIEAQADYIWDKIKKVLEAAGSGLDDVVKIFQFVVGHENFARMSVARRRVLGKDPLPASTAIVVVGLAGPEMLLEVDVIAVTGD